ncbi:hypothetical protein NUM3379_26390 [Kineococcus sp. NUM-3379]
MQPVEPENVPPVEPAEVEQVEPDVVPAVEPTEVEEVEPVEPADVPPVELEAPEPYVVDAERVEDGAEDEAPPVPHWDELTLASIRARLRHYSLPKLHTLQAYEQAHAARPGVISMLENRIALLDGKAEQDDRETGDHDG